MNKKEPLNFAGKLKELKAENTKLKKEVEGANQTACNFQDLAIKHERTKNEAVRLKKKYYEKCKELKREIEWHEKIFNALEETTYITGRERDLYKKQRDTLLSERTYRHVALAVSILFNLVIGIGALAFIIDKYI